MDNDNLSAEAAVLAYLAGTPLAQAAQEHGLPASRLQELVDRFTTAGRTALRHAPSPWQQFNIEFAANAHHETIAADYVLPVLLRARANGDVTWWFLRKPPGWRLRVLPTPSPTVDHVEELTAALRAAHATGMVRRWWCSPYEEETLAFGGETGMALAHELFAADSAGIARLLMKDSVDGDEPDRRLLSLLLMTHLQRAAGLDLNERGDVWARVAAQRTPAELPAAAADALAQKARVVLTTDTTALTRPGGPLHPVADWAHDIAEVGARLGAAARQGCLQRGLRTVLALHVLFHWNRLGLGADQQSIWATTTKNALLGDR